VGDRGAQSDVRKRNGGVVFVFLIVFFLHFISGIMLTNKL
jgi:hypothetical protein